MLNNEQLDLLLVYLPHLDYDHQRFGPEGPEALKAARELDDVLGDLVEHARDRGDQVVVLSEYGITPAKRPVEINRALRRAGLLNVYTQAGMEYLDPWTSRAFAVSDHQIAHVYIGNPADVPAAREAIAALDGVGEVLDGEALAAAGLAHERSGELVVLAERDAWFTYHYWLDNEHAPDFGRQVEIHRKPGYDPAELFMDPDDEKGAKLRAGLALARKTTGFRYVMSVVGLDASKYVKGTHGLLPPGDEDGPVFLCSEKSHARERVAATDVRDLILDLCGRPRERPHLSSRARRRRNGARNVHFLTPPSLAGSVRAGAAWRGDARARRGRDGRGAVARGRRRGRALPTLLSACRCPKRRGRPEWPGQPLRAPERARSP